MNEYEVQANYGWGYEEVFTATTRAEALSVIKDYRDNVPEFTYRLVGKRVAV